MSDYPRRGKMSKDGKYYTSTNGNVYEFGKRKIEGAYVPTDEESEACDMARAAITKCEKWHKHAMVETKCNCCQYFLNKDCPARAYLAEHGCADAWEVKP